MSNEQAEKTVAQAGEVAKVVAKKAVGIWSGTLPMRAASSWLTSSAQRANLEGQAALAMAKAVREGKTREEAEAIRDAILAG